MATIRYSQRPLQVQYFLKALLKYEKYNTQLFSDYFSQANGQYTAIILSKNINCKWDTPLNIMKVMLTCSVTTFLKLTAYTQVQ